jgi:hypothetical protein
MVIIGTAPRAKEFKSVQAHNRAGLFRYTRHAIPIKSRFYAAFSCPGLNTLNSVLLLILHRDICQRRLQRIGRLPRELARRNFMLEHQIQLRVREALGLRKAEVAPHDEKQCNASPEESTLGTPIPIVLSDHLRHDGVGDENDRVVGCAGQSDGFDAQAGGGDLGGEGVADWSEGELAM